MSLTRHVIPIAVLAPPKPAVGQPCNGCGLCCLYQPCPLGMVLSGARQGACAALRWDERTQRYLCGAMVAPHEVLQQAGYRGIRPLAGMLAPVLRRLAGRWIASGQGCDSTIETDDSPA
jgi:hypothetical protein